MDDARSVSDVYFLTKRSESFGALKSYKVLVENQWKESVYDLSSGRGGENISGDIKSFLQSQCMKIESSPGYGRHSNRFSERIIQSIWLMALTMMNDSRIDLQIWAEEISHFIWLRNRIPTKRINFEIH